MNSKIELAHKQIDGSTVARMIIDFQCEFREVYDRELMVSQMMAVGPMQSFIGNAIAKGIIKLEKPDDWETIPPQKKSGTIHGSCFRRLWLRLQRLW